MPANPYAKLRMAIDGGSFVTGGQTVAGGNVVQLSGESTVGWVTQLWEIYEYPIGFACPAGWTNVNGIYQSTSVTPSGILIPAAATTWGKYFFRLTVNNGLLEGEYRGSDDPTQPLVDDHSAIQTLSPALLLCDIGFGESNQFDSQRAWIGEYKKNLRLIETAVGAGGSSFLTVGVNPASAGIIRIPNNEIIKARNGVNTADVSMISVNSGDSVIVGGTGAAAAIIQATGTGGFYDGSSYSWICNFGGVNAGGFPLVGLSIPQSSVNGVGVQAMANADQTAAAAIYERRIIRTTGAITANRTLTLPSVSSDVAAYEKIIDNQCTGAFSIVISVGAGTTVSIANVRRAVIMVDTTGVRRVTADQA